MLRVQALLLQLLPDVAQVFFEELVASLAEAGTKKLRSETAVLNPKQQSYYQTDKEAVER